MVLADGAPIVLASRLLRRGLPERIAGIRSDAASRLLSAERKYKPFLLGARREVVGTAADVLAKRHPGLVFAGIRDGYWDAADADAVREIRESGEDLLFVAMPTPRKEKFLLRHRESLGDPFAMGVGGSFDVFASAVRRAPVSWQRMGMEWAYRLIQEPRKMWKRYLVTNSHFLWLTVKEALGAGASRRIERKDERAV